MQLLTPADAAGRVTAALKSAAEATGAGFDYLLRTATRESSLNATAKNPSSSARGLFQFIDSTWLETMKEEGPKLGLADVAADITKTASGRYTVADPVRRTEILAMRDDPQTSALMAAAFTRRNAQTFEAALGRAPTDGELYAAHFMGAQGAIELTSLAANQPTASAAASFPSQASANRTIFYTAGHARSAREVYDRLTATPAGATVVAQAQTQNPAQRVTRPALALQASDDASVAPFNGGRENDGQAFHSLFKTGRRTPVASYVQQAWAGFGSAGLASDGASAKGVRATSALGYAPVAAAPATAVTTPNAEAAAMAVEQAARTYAAKPRATRTVQRAAASTAAAVQAAPPAFPTQASRKVELTSFLGVQLPSWLSGTASSTARGRP